MGYRYGVWLAIKSPEILQHINTYNEEVHYPHVTIMCNMKRSDARKLRNELNKQYNIMVMDEYIIFNNKYSSKDKLLASGCLVNVEDWMEIQKIAKKYCGSPPSKPHITLAYRQTEEELPIVIDLKKEIIIGEIVVANIKSDNPQKWEIIK